MNTDIYDFAAIEKKWQDKWRQEKTFKVDAGFSCQKILPAGDVPLPIGPHPHGACAQLLHR